MGDPQLITLFQQVIQVFIPVIRGFDNIVVEHKVVAGTVAHQNLAVPVQNIAPGGPDGGHGAVGGGVIRVALGVDNLQLEQPEGEQHQNK